MTTLHELIDREFGIRTREREDTPDVSLDVNDTIVIRADSSRVGFIIVNTGAEIALMRFNRTPSAAVNIPIAADGGTLNMTYKEDYHLVGRELHGLVAANTTTLHVLEVLIEP